MDKFAPFLDFMIDQDPDTDAPSFVLGFELGGLFRDLQLLKGTMKYTLHRQNDERINYFISRLGWRLINRINLDETWMEIQLERK